MRVDADIVEILGRAKCDGRHLALTDQLDRRAYSRVSKAIDAAGGRWDRRLGLHVFDRDAATAIEPILIGGTIRSDRDFGFFETPAPLAAKLVALADVRPGMHALEPSAGRGAIARALRDAGATVMCVEIFEKNVEALRLAGFSSIMRHDFLALEQLSQFDRIVMNPPFGGQADLAHVRRATALLKPDGKLVSVLAAGAMFRTNSAAVAFREFVAARGGTIEPLPDGSFRASGTDVRSCVAVIPGVAI